LIIATIIAFIAPETNIIKELFWLSASLIGIMIGPNQSCSRSFMIKITPKDKLNEFFGFFALAGKSTSFLGPLLFGFITIHYSQQMALLVVLFFFVVGLFLFNQIDFNSLD
jgi:UMF1 family MFS transporter